MTTTAAAVARLHFAINQALTAGVPRRQIFAMVATAPPPKLREDWPYDPSEIVYHEVPAGCLTLTDAAAKYHVRHNTLSVAISRGMLADAGRVTKPSPSGEGQGRKQVIVPEAALRHYLGLPPDPDDSPDSEMGLVPGLYDLPIYTEMPEGLIAVPAAAEKLGIPTQRLNEWVRSGILSRMGYLRDDGQGQSALLVVEAEVTVLRMMAAMFRGGVDDD